MADQRQDTDSAELAIAGSGNGISAHPENLALKKELWERGYYVNEVNRGGGIEYLIVSASPPHRQITDHNAN